MLLENVEELMLLKVEVLLMRVDPKIVDVAMYECDDVELTKSET